MLCTCQKLNSDVTVNMDQIRQLFDNSQETFSNDSLYRVSNSIEIIHDGLETFKSPSL